MHHGKFASLTRQSKLLEVPTLCHQLGPQNALQLQVVGIQITNFAQHSSDEFGWTIMPRVCSQARSS